MKTAQKAISKNLEPLTLNSQLILTIIESIQEKKGEEIISLDLKHVNESIADYFIICQATNQIQLKAIADFIEKKVLEDCQQKPYRVEGNKGKPWIILDYVDVVIHCMMPDARKFYNLEELWHDANKKEH